jgi:simple sugar transport system permease protein
MNRTSAAMTASDSALRHSANPPPASPPPASTAAATTTAALPAWRQALRAHDGDGTVRGLLGLLLLLCIVFSLLLPGRFATVDTLQSVLMQVPELGLLALAQLLPLISGGINLGIIASTNMAGLAMAWVLTGGLASWGLDPAAQPLLTLAVALAAGALLALATGLASGWLVANVQAHPILVTLGTMSLVNGLCVWLTRGKPIAGFPEPFLALGSGSWLGIPLPFWLFCAATLAMWAYLERSRHGLAVCMVGSNLEATRYSGIDTRRVLIAVYTISTLMCWLAAVLMMARFNSASAGYAQSYLLVTVLAAILGGIDPLGGFGKVAGLFIALLVLQVISSGVNLLGINAQLTQAMWGATLIAAMAVRHWAARRRPRRH